VAPLLLLGGLIGSAGLFLIIYSWGVKAASANSLEARLRVYEKPLTLDEMELQASFSERVLTPIVEMLRSYLSDRTPENARLAVQQQLILAGRPGNLSPGDFQGLRYAMTVVFFVFGLVIGALLKNPLFLVLLAAGGAVAGFYFPVLWIRQKIDRRRKAISVAIPDALDLLTIAVEAGLGFDAAITRVTEKFQNALTDEFNQAMKEIRLGRSRVEAMDDMGRRSGVEELHNFVQAIIQSEQLGVGIAKVLRVQADEMRRKRRQRAQEKGAQATLKMMLPMIGCIFPTIWIVLLGPSVLILMNINR
jgi:tight adherence protein C